MKVKTLVRATLRGTQFILLLTLGVLLVGLSRLLNGRHWHLTEQGQARIRWWTQQLTRIVGIRIIQYGRPVAAHVLFVSNHISFLDTIVITSTVPARFLSKHSVRSWPVIGFLAQLTGSLFIKRGQRSQVARTLDAIKQALSQTRPVLIFPEGTTSLGQTVLKFHSGLFQAAIDAQVPVQALSLYYCHRQQPDRLAAYIDKDNFVFSLLRLMARPQTEVHLSFTPPIDCDKHTRQSLAAFCHARISQNLQYQLQHAQNLRPIDAIADFAILGECER